MRSAVLGLCVFASLNACKTAESDESAVKIFGGAPTSDLPAVVAILSNGNCTATFVSPTVLVTAAHCIADADTGNVTFTDASGQTHRSIKVWTRDFIGDEVIRNIVPYVMQQDFAIVQFGEAVAPETMPLAFDRLAGSEDVTLIGFGFTERNDHGRKYKVDTKLEAVSDQMSVVRGTKNIASGDSGGPLVIGRKVYGVASFGTTEDRTPKRVGCHALLSHPDNLELLKKAKAEGADIPGVPAPPAQRPSTRAVSGTYKALVFCVQGGPEEAARPHEESRSQLGLCNQSLTFGPNGRVQAEVTEAMLSLSFTYKQTQSRVLVARGDAPINERDPATFTAFKVIDDGRTLMSDAGTPYRAGGAGPTPRPNPNPAPTGGGTTALTGKTFKATNPNDWNPSLTFEAGNKVALRGGEIPAGRVVRMPYTLEGDVVSFRINQEGQIMKAKIMQGGRALKSIVQDWDETWACAAGCI